MKKFVSVLVVFSLLISAPLWAGSPTLSTGCCAQHTLVISDNGTVYAWGHNDYGQLGNNSTTNSNVPVAVDTSGVLSGKTITAFAAGESHTLALASDGTVYAWGKNSHGQLGNNLTTDSHVPVAVDMSGVLSGKTITAVVAGAEHSIALASDGSVYTWGKNSYGQLGNNLTTDSYVPVAVDTSGVLSGKTATKIASGSCHVVVLTSDSTAYAWGWNKYGQLGDKSTTDSSVPVAVDTSKGFLFGIGKTITAVTAGTIHTAVLTSDDKVYAWGWRRFGQSDYSPVEVNPPHTGAIITSIATGSHHSVTLASDGIVYTWGDNSDGQLGNTFYNETQFCVQVNMSGALSGKTITAVAAGLEHSVVMASDGTVYTWGRNDYGQLGNNSTTNSGVPVQVVFDAGSGVVFPENGIPQEYSLNANYPNPFNPSTTISFELSAMSDVKLTIYDMNGKIVSTLINNAMPAGYHETSWDASDLSSGIYFYRLQAGDFVDTKKMIFMK
jgi:alpha-tubulin suppressor-like RCC1 family protein